MNDMVYIGIAAVAGIAALLFILALNVYNGIHGSLSTAKVGEVYNFDYEQPFHGERQRILAKVIEPVYTLSDETIRKLDRTSSYRRHDSIFKRTHHLVTCQTFDGKIRQFYAERATNVRRFPMGNVLMKTGLASLLF
jgi:hypothetical protein